MNLKLVLLILVLVIAAKTSFAAENYKPYLHKATVPDHPNIILYGQYQTNLFPGAATYSYPIEIPKGTNGLQPSIAIYYSSQSSAQRPGILGAGWSIVQSNIYRKVNGTVNDVSDDQYILVLDGTPYELVYNEDGSYHTEVEYNFKIQYLSGAGNSYGNYWIVTKKDGTKYRFGYNLDSELLSNTGRNYAVKWSLDLITDTHGNNIYFSYLKDPYGEDRGTQYLNTILYNNDQRRKIEFAYEPNLRPDNRLIYDQGNLLDESRRLSDINVYADSGLVRKYHFEYTNLSLTLSSIANILRYGTDNLSVLHNISFSYYLPDSGYNKNSTTWALPVFFSSGTTDNGIRIVDANNDGFADIMKRDNSENKVWINNKQGSWILDSSWTVKEAIVLNNINQGVEFADVNNDGFVDLIKAKADQSKVIYLNNGIGWSQSNWVFPSNIAIVDSSGNDLGVRFADVNGDGKVDIIKAQSSTRAVYINNKTSWMQDSSWVVPVDFLNGATDTGVRFIDVNGDGLPDLIQGTTAAWINTGANWVSNDSWKSPVAFINATNNDNGARFADVNGDGLFDILVQNTNAYINNGSGWIQDNSWKSPEKFIDGSNSGIRLADISGDGFADIVVSHDSQTYNFTQVRTTNFPYMLKTIKNEYGGITNITYTTSTQFNNIDNGTSRLGFNIWVVKNVTSDNGLSNNFKVLGSITYNYSYGKYNYQNSEFRGFGLGVELKPDKVVKHYFLQDDARRSKEYRTEIYDINNTLYSKSEKDYYVVKSGSIYNITLRSSTDYLYDGNANPVITNKSYTYDFYNNLLFMIDYGDISVAGDEKYYNFTYAMNPTYWVMDRVASEKIYDSNYQKLKETRYYYDNYGLTGLSTKGELTETGQWDSNGNDIFNYFEYDAYGNLVKKTDSYGNSAVFSYDATHTYPATTINALGHIAYFNYDLGTGNLKWQKKNDITTNFNYDTFGRMIKEIQPYDSSSLPTKLYNYSFDGIAPETVTVNLRTTTSKTNDVSYYYDGFANLVQLKTTADNGQQIVKNIFYDSQGRVANEQNPYFYNYSLSLTDSSAAANFTYYSYDAADRVTKVTNPDGTTKNISFNQLNITDFDENGNRHMYSLDALGRIVKVYEYNTNDVGVPEIYSTSYEYDGNDNLIRIIDQEGHIYTFAYDSLGRKTSMDDPNLGYWTYTYDKNSNLITQTDARGYTIRLSYDALNRVVNKTSADVNLSFVYDKDYQGTLANITTGNITYSYEYDERLRVVRDNKLMNGISLAAEYLYDSQDRLVSIIRNGQHRDYIYGKQGILSIPGIVNATNYNAFGSMLNKTYANGIITTYSFDAQNNRLKTIYASGVQNLTYGYDNGGNIVSIIDLLQNRNHLLRYDNLNRLIGATIGADRYVYSYNALGNMMKIVTNNQSKKLVYNGKQAHAPSQIIDGSAGVDVYNLRDYNSTNKTRFYEFYLVNDKNTSSITANFTINFGDGTSFTNNSVTVVNYTRIIVNHTYANAGDYAVNITAASAGIFDRQNISNKFGIRVNALNSLYSGISEKVFEFISYNDMLEPALNISTNCSDNITLINSANLTSGQYLYDYIANNYTSPGDKIFTCTAKGSDGTDSKSIKFKIDGLEIENYDVLISNVSRRVVTYDVKNYFTPIVNINISMKDEQNSFSNLINLSAGEKIMIFAETNYSSEGSKTFAINVTSGNYTGSYIDSFGLKWVAIENYNRLSYNNTRNIFLFNVKNNWYSGKINWSISDPNLVNYTNMTNNESILVIIESNYSQGTKKPVVSAYASAYRDTVNDYFVIKPLEIASVQALNESMNPTVQFIIKNNLNITQQFSWRYNTGTQNITNTTTSIPPGYLTITLNSAYSAPGIYKTTLYVNNTLYNDTKSGMVVAQ